MGLDTSHNCWHGPYSSFSEWRNFVVRTAGYALTPYPNGRGEYAAVVLDNPDQFVPKNYQGKWDVTPRDPLLILIVHSDCDGKIKHKHTKKLAKRLEEIMAWMPEDEPRAFGWGMRARTQQFIDGLMAAYEAGDDVVFH